MTHANLSPAVAIGQRFGKLVVTARVSGKDARAAGFTRGYWALRCDCGRTTRASNSTMLTAGRSTSCGCAAYLAPRGNGKTAPLNLLGKQFGKLTVVEQLSVAGNRGRRWRCACSCGGYLVATSKELVAGRGACRPCVRKALSTTQFVDITGMRFGYLTAVSLSHVSLQGAHWLCKCDCGKERVARGKDLRNGNTASCGCLKSRPGQPCTSAGRGRPGVVALDIARPWRKPEPVDNSWLVLIGAAPRPAGRAS